MNSVRQLKQMRMKERDQDSDISIQLKAIVSDLKCPNSYQIKRICDNEECAYPALFCNEEHCDSCAQLHQNCRSYSFQKFTKVVQKRSTGPISQFMDRVTQLQASMMDTIQKHKRKFIQTFTVDEHIFNLQPKYFRMIQQIYKNKNIRGMIGKQASQLFLKLKQSQIEPQSRQQQLLDVFQTQIQRITKQFTQVKDWIITSIMGQQRYQKKTKEKRQETLSIQSQILRHKNYSMKLQQLINSSNKKIGLLSQVIVEQLEKQDRLFIKESFSYPNLKFQPIFRASDNDYSSSRFHQICDHIEHTFTVVHNQFGKTFAGFTPLNWFGDNLFKADLSNSSFLISFDQRLKLTLQNRNKAIYCSQSVGPTFGGDTNYLKIFNSYDLLIGDKCHSNATSYYDFPKSYQFASRSTDSSHIFGVEKGKKFKVFDYQVFKVSVVGEQKYSQ